ncbi:hypothetical protein EDD86DRAFT_248988 [Gorgonomyces haynaldii]|nr:hypothetical protein EDD86DRAFT_248988 [Gorgonomyces haynaldii]
MTLLYPTPPAMIFNICQVTLMIIFITYDMLHLWYFRSHPSYTKTLIVAFVCFVMLVYDYCLILNYMETLGYRWRTADSVLRYITLCVLIIYAMEIQKLFTGITPHWDHRRITRWQIIYAVTISLIQIPAIAIKAWTAEQSNLIITILNVIWAILTGLAGSILSIRTTYIVYNFAYKSDFTECKRLEIRQQFRKCIASMVSLLICANFSVVVYILAYLIKVDDDINTVGLLIVCEL